MLKIKHRRLDNMTGTPLLAPIKHAILDFIHRPREKKVMEVFAQTYREPTPFFHQVQVETCSFCNNNCHFCPASNEVDTRPKEYMDWEVINTLVSQLKDIQFNGLVSLFNNNDPLIDKRMPEIVACFKNELPDAKTEIYTNGILLNVDIAEKLWQAGLDSLVVDYYYTSEEKRTKKIDIFVEEYYKSEYCQQHDVTIRYINKEMVRSSRGGEAPNKKVGRGAGFCSYPFMQFNVNYKGEAYLCCNDVYYQQVLGNITQEHIREIWNSPRYQSIRKRLLNDNRNFGICKNCDTKPIFKGSKSLVLQEDNNQIVIPERVKSGLKFNTKKPYKEYSLE